MPRLLVLPALTFALVLVFAALRPAAAQGPAEQDAGPIATDRPGFAFSPVVVPARSFQAELGTPTVTRSGTAGATATSLSVPVALRYGLTDRLELRAGGPVYNRLSSEADGVDATDSGFGDLELGLKYQVLAAGAGSQVNLSLIPSVVVPVGSSGFTAGDPVVNANAVGGFALPSGFGLTVVAGATVPTADGAQVVANLVGLVGRSFSDRVSGYVEAAAFPTDGATPVYAGAGLAFLATPTVQLDAALDVGLTDGAADLIGGVGVSVRLGR